MTEEFCYFLIEKKKVLNPEPGVFYVNHHCALRKNLDLSKGVCPASVFSPKGCGDLRSDYNLDSAKDCFCFALNKEQAREKISGILKTFEGL